MTLKFPKGKEFAFTIVDDTDFATVNNVKPVYRLLESLGFRTTKSVWVFASNEPQVQPQHTLSDPEYLSWIIDLKNDGFEIASHGAREGNSKREEVIESMQIFKKNLGCYPKVHLNHFANVEQLYWGASRFDLSFLRLISYCVSRSKGSLGHVPESRYFWGDFAQKHITYTRNFVFRGINTIKFDPFMPYYDPRRSYVNFWFSSSDGFDVERFNTLLEEKNQIRLQKEHGICIVYTHFGYGFVKNGEVNPHTRALLESLSKRNGWFVPVGTLLDYIKSQRACDPYSNLGRKMMELRWIRGKVAAKLLRD